MIPQPLLDDIVNRKCLPVIGAGFSKNATLSNGNEMPDWKQLANDIGKVLNTNKSVPMEILQEYEEKFGRTKLIEEVARNIPLTGVMLGEVHKYFAKILPFDLIYTTNFDLLLEDSLKQESKRDCKSMAGEKQLALFASYPSINIVKMHGDLIHPEYLVMTKKDYDEYLIKYSAIATHLSASLITRTPLFIGYSLTDPNFCQIRKIIQDRLGEFTRRGYIVLFDATQQEIEEYNKLHLSVINLGLGNKSHSEALLEFLREICTYTTTYSIKNAIQSASEFEKIENKEISDKIQIDTAIDTSLSTVIKSIATAETTLQKVLEKRGIKERELKKSLRGLSSLAFQLGLLSSNDIGLIADIMGVRNEVIHRGKSLSEDQAKWIISNTKEITEKISKMEAIANESISINVSVDSSTYTDGDTITITGHVKPIIKNMPMTIQILDSKDTLIQIMQSEVDDNGRSVSITKAIGALWEIDGKYTVRAQYGSATIIAEDKFYFKHRIARAADTFPVQYNDKTFEIKYNIRGGSVRHIEVDPAAKSLRLLVNSVQDGDVLLEIPRNLIDAKMYNDEDDKFLIMIDGAEVNYIETKTNDTRNISIRFLKGDYSIEIIGTKLPPLEKILVSGLVILEENKNPINEIIENKPILISAYLINNQDNAQKYSFIVQIQRDGMTVDNLWVDGIMRAGESSQPYVKWTPKNSGKYDVQVFVWQNVENPNELASPKHLEINIRKKDQTKSVVPMNTLDEIISNLDTIIETYSGFPPTKNQLNEAIKLYDLCWQWAKEKYPSKYEINLLRTQPVSIIRLFAAPNPSRELKDTTDELVIKAKRLKKIISVQLF